MVTFNGPYYLSLSRHDLAALPANSYDPLRFNRGTMESTLSSDQCPSESETTPRYYRISRTSQVSFTDNRQSSISEPPIAIDDAREEPTTVNSTELPPETVPRFPTTGPTAQVSATDGHYSSISEPSIAIDDSREESTANKTSTGTGTASTAGTSVEEVSSAIANACTLLTSWYTQFLPVETAQMLQLLGLSSQSILCYCIS